MTASAEFIELIEKELSKKRYSNRTVSAYVMCIRQLAAYFDETPPTEISETQLREYFAYLSGRKRSAASSIKQVWHAADWFFNDYLKKGYDLTSIPTPVATRDVPEILTQSEVLSLLNSIKNSRAKAALALIYSIGLDLTEAVQLKLSDVDFTNKKVRVKILRRKGVRNAVLSDHACKLLKEYIEQYKPVKWLFEGREKGTPYSKDAIQKAFRTAARANGITKRVSVRSLRYSYVKHLEQQGVPLISILREMGIMTEKTFTFFSLIGHEDKVIGYSPLDALIENKEKGKVDVASLRRILLTAQSKEEQDYLTEAIICVQAGAYRAGVIFAWMVAIRNIQNKCLRHSTTIVNASLKKFDAKAREVKDIDDFAYVKDSVVLEACQDLGIFDKNEKAILVECLGLRNKCGHPGKYAPQPLKVAAFIEDLIAIVFAKP